MIKQLASVEEYMDFVSELNHDPNFSEPMLTSEEQFRCNLLDAPNRPGNKLLGVFEGETLTGLFNFLVEEEESYLEMLVGLSRSPAAYEELLSFLKENYKGYRTDFVYNPRNHLLHGLLQREDAEFFPEVQKMVLKRDVPYQSSHRIELYSPKYREQYCAIHEDGDRYWTAEKVIDATEKFRIILALEGDKVVGYIDITHQFEENEPFDVFVVEEYRRRGFAKAMLARAIELNRPKGIMLLVDADDAGTIALYESMGFDKVEGQNNVTAYVVL